MCIWDRLFELTRASLQFSVFFFFLSLSHILSRQSQCPFCQSKSLQQHFCSVCHWCLTCFFSFTMVKVQQYPCTQCSNINSGLCRNLVDCSFLFERTWALQRVLTRHIVTSFIAKKFVCPHYQGLTLTLVDFQSVTFSKFQHFRQATIFTSIQWGFLFFEKLYL